MAAAAAMLLLGVSCAARPRASGPTQSENSSQDPRRDQIEQLESEIRTNRQLMGLDPPDPAWTQASETTCTDMCHYASEICRAQEHICILSGLYGVLRPLDRMQPYRLEMGTKLAVGPAKNLYQFWGTRIADYLNQRVAAQKTPVVVNLASQEYSKAVDRSVLKARVVDCVFEEWRGGGYKIISFSAKKARGLMARYATARRIDAPHKLEAFSADGYAFDAGASFPDRMVFRRRMEK